MNAFQPFHIEVKCRRVDVLCDQRFNPAQNVVVMDAASHAGTHVKGQRQGDESAIWRQGSAER